MTLLVITPIISFGVMLIWLFYIFTQPENHEIVRFGKELSRHFISYQNKIYVLISGRGYHLLQEADSDSFRMVSEDNHNIALDKFQVYCGRTPLEGLDPKSLQIIGLNYVTDGKKYYYCGSTYQLPKVDLSEKLKRLPQHLFHFVGLGSRPMDYQFPNNEMYNISGQLKNKNEYASLATDDKHVYYQGHIIPNADSKTIRVISEGHYLTDNKRVYFGLQPLEIGYQKDLSQFKFAGSDSNQEFYLYSPSSGELAVNGLIFPRENIPYRLFSPNHDYVNHKLWLGSDNGIYYYDRFEEKIQKMGNNPMSANAQEIFPGIWLDEGVLYFLQSKDINKKNRSGDPVSRSYQTTLSRLDSSSAQWQKIAENSEGAVWKNGEELYYFNQAIYRIKDPSSLSLILKKHTNSEIRKLIEEKKLVPVKGKILLSITKTEYISGTFMWFSIIFIPLFVFVLSRFLHLYFKDDGANILKSIRRPFDIANGKLWLYQLFPKKYPLQNLQKVEFSYHRSGKNHLGIISLYLQGRSRPIKSKFVASRKSEEDAKACIKVLKDKLKMASINVG
ncbi:MAG: DKNYY domain-containing protein [Lonepinella koalarum]|nr:DKNYY domain-containing protein [Lonepinella koalarum]